MGASAGLGILDTSNVTVLADGARWIWEEALNHLRGAAGVLDIFHAIEHLADAARSVFGEGTDAANVWLDESRRVLVSSGWPGISDYICNTRKLAAGGSETAVSEGRQREGRRGVWQPGLLTVPDDSMYAGWRSKLWFSSAVRMQDES